jgi:hypothetical protein
MKLWKTKKERQWLKRLRELDDIISDNASHILGHKAVIDKAKIEKDKILAEIDVLRAVK